MGPHHTIKPSRVSRAEPKTKRPEYPALEHSEPKYSEPEHPAPADAQLKQRLLMRDDSSLSKIYDEHSGAVFGVLCRFLDHASAEEVLQDIFVRLWEKPEAFDPQRASLRAYLLVVARSRALDQLRKQRKQKLTLPLYTEEEQEWPLPDPHQNPSQQSEERQQREFMANVLQQLSATHRETVERAYLQGQSRSEIAQAMNTPVGTVKSRLSYALKYLKQALGKEAHTWLE